MADGDGSRSILPRSILVVCSANQCRSPLVAAFLIAKLRARGLTTTVTSVGTRTRPGVAATDSTQQVARRHDLDLSAHRSTELSTDAVRDADLVLGLERVHVREVVALAPQAWPRTFTLKELVRLGTAAGPRPADEPAAQWLARLSAGRRPTDLLGASPLDDVDDPTSSYATDHPTLAEDIDRLTDHLLVLLYGP